MVYKKFSDEIKKSCIADILRGALTLREIAIKHAVSFGSVCGWSVKLSEKQKIVRDKNKAKNSLKESQAQKKILREKYLSKLRALD